MKSVFFVALFVMLAAAVSQPDRSKLGFDQLQVSLPDKLPLTSSSKSSVLLVNSKPKLGLYQFKLPKTGLAWKELGLSGLKFSFPMADCQYVQKPKFSFNCSLGKAPKVKSSTWISFSVNPIFVVGQEESDLFLVELTSVDKSGNKTKHQFFTESRGVLLQSLPSAVKVSQK